MDTSDRAVESLKLNLACNSECDTNRGGLDLNSIPQVNNHDCAILKNASCPVESSSSSIQALSSGMDDKLLSSSPTSLCAEQNKSDLIPVPPSTPKLGVPLLAHKLWIGNLDKRLTE